MNVWPVVWSTLLRHRNTYILFVVLIAVATAIGIGVTTQESALRLGSARAADKFDLIVAAPGSSTDVVLTAIYLRPGTVPLLSPAMTAKALAEPRAGIAAPLGFGDNYHGAPIVGTVASFVTYLSGSGLAEGRLFASQGEAVVGAATAVAIGASFHPEHGMEEDADGDQHEHAQTLTVVGRMRPTGTPWDNAIVVPIEFVWAVHALPIGHTDPSRIGPPFEADKVPGVPAIVIKPQTINAAYGLRNVYKTSDSMAFFPAEVLVRLYGVLGNIRQIMSALAIGTQGLVALSILAGVMAVLSLHRRQFAVLRALGAPRAYLFLCVWMQVALVTVCGALLGLGLGYAVSLVIAQVITGQTGIVLPVSLGLDEFELLLAMIVFGLVVGTIPAFLIYRRPVIDALHQM